MTEIQKRRLGSSGIQVTEIGLGLWAMGGKQWGPTEDQASLDTIDAALDAGVNLFDTADVYGNGHSEDLLGQAMKGRRDQFIVATKIGWNNFNEDQDHTQYDTVTKLVAGVEENLHRLQSDYIDLIQWHINRREKTMEIALEGFQRLQQEGKVRAYGVSTSDLEFLKAFNADGKCSSLQIDYSILNRTPEAEIFSYCQEMDMGILIRGPLAMGILTGKFTPESRFAPGDFRTSWIENAEENEVFLRDLEAVEELKSLTSQNRSLAQLALQFSIEHPAVTSTIPGAKTVQQLGENLAVARLGRFSAEDLDVIDRLSPPGGGRKIWPA